MIEGEAFAASEVCQEQPCSASASTLYCHHIVKAASDDEWRAFKRNEHMKLLYTKTIGSSSSVPLVVAL